MCVCVRSRGVVAESLEITMITRILGSREVMVAMQVEIVVMVAVVVSVCACNEICTPKLTTHCTCHEIRAPRRSPPCPMRLPHIEVKPFRSLHLSRKVNFGPPQHEVSLAPATKSDHHVRKCARHHNESAVATSARSSHLGFASLKCTWRTSRGMTVL